MGEKIDILTSSLKNYLNNKKILFVVMLSLLTLGVYSYYGMSQKNIYSKNRIEIAQDVDNADRLICDRTTRLDNAPNIDRALSLIHERLTEYGEDDSPFPPKLINCIKVEIKHIKNETGAEGYFDENNEDIKSNYFPIVIDDLGNFFSDDLSTALLLVHEITHVHQYINKYNFGVDPTWEDTPLRIFSKMTKSRCLNNEVSAYKNQLLFTLRLKNEERKSLNYRVIADEHPIPQIELLGSLKIAFDDFSFASSCEEKYDIDCIDGSINLIIYEALRDSGVYDEQCSVYEGSY